jgi:class 3 adenylate cyclase
VSVLFCDLVGFARAEQRDPEDVSALLSRYHVRLRAELERHGGTVEKFVGDAALALFGAPVAHEDDPERAVRAALSICDWIAELGDDLEVRVGISTGETLVRLGTPAAEGEALAMGDVVSTAARLQQAAPRGGVLVGEATYRATRAAIVYERLDPVVVKGKAEPVPVWLAKSYRRAANADEERPTTPFVGRGQDLASLEQSFARAMQGSAVQLVTVVGEPGIGKTRLVGEFRNRVEAGDEPATWRQGRCLPYGDGITFWALGQIVKEEAGILESDGPAAAAAKLEAAVALVAEEADRRWLTSRLAPLVGIARSDDSTAQEEAFVAWRTYLEALAAHRPLVLVVEDIHWADSALLAFLDHLVEWGADVPLLVVGTARPEVYDRAPAWAGGKRNAATISLAPLGDDDTARLVSELLADSLPAAAQATLLERAEGNPLYAEEFARMLGDRGLLAGRSGAAALAAGDIPVPEGIHGVIAARLDTLSPERKRLVHDAAVVGKVFWAGALAAMAREPKEAVLAGLHELARKELVRRVRSSSIADDVEYAFWHVLVRDVAYGQIPRAERARKHIAVADWIKRISGDRVGDHAEFLSYHYRTALELTDAAGSGESRDALVDAAVRFGALAAERAARLDHTRGEHYYRQTLSLLPADDPRRPKLLGNAAFAGVTAGAPFEQIKAELEEAIAGLLAQGDPVAAADAMRQLSFAMFGRAESVPLAEEAYRLLEGHPPTPELALICARLAQELLIVGRREEAIAWARRALPLLEQFGLDDEHLTTRSRIASLEEMRKLAREALDPQRGYGTHAATSVLNNLAAEEHWFGAGPAAAMEALRTAAGLAERRGLERPSRWYRGCLAEPLYDLGEWDEVLQIHVDIAAWEDIRGKSAIGTFALPYAARIHAARGDAGTAAAIVHELLDRTSEVRETMLGWIAIFAAFALAASAWEAERALGYLADLEAVEVSPSETIGYLPELGRACVAVGAVDRFERYVERAREVPQVARFAVAADAILAEARGDHAGAARLYEQARSGFEQHGGLVELEQALLGVARCRLAAGEPDATEPLREARAAGPK